MLCIAVQGQDPHGACCLRYLLPMAPVAYCRSGRLPGWMSLGIRCWEDGCRMRARRQAVEPSFGATSARHFQTLAALGEVFGSAPQTRPILGEVWVSGALLRAKLSRKPQDSVREFSCFSSSWPKTSPNVGQVVFQVAQTTPNAEEFPDASSLVTPLRHLLPFVYGACCPGVGTCEGIGGHIELLFRTCFTAGYCRFFGEILGLGRCVSRALRTGRGRQRW